MKRIRLFFQTMLVFMVVLTMSASVYGYNFAFDYTLDTDGVPTTTNNSARVFDFNDPSDPWNGATFTSDTSAIVSGSLSGKYAAPYITDSSQEDPTPYLTVPEASDADSSGYVKVDLGFTANYFGLFWGSIDDYNTISFFRNGTPTESITGLDVNDPADGNQTAAATNRFVNIWDLDPFTGFELSSTQFAFEVDNVAAAPVPEPATVFLMGIGLAGLWGIRRRKFNKS